MWYPRRPPHQRRGWGEDLQRVRWTTLRLDQLQTQLVNRQTVGRAHHGSFSHSPIGYTISRKCCIEFSPSILTTHQPGPFSASMGVFPVHSAVAVRRPCHGAPSRFSLLTTAIGRFGASTRTIGRMGKKSPCLWQSSSPARGCIMQRRYCASPATDTVLLLKAD